MPSLSLIYLWRNRTSIRVLLCAVAVVLFAAVAPADGLRDMPGAGGSFYGEQLRPKYSNQPSSSEISKVGWTQNLGRQIPLDLSFQDDNGKPVELQKYFHQKPVVMAMVYYTCPFLCGEVLRGTFKGLESVNFQAGKDYELVVVSINPKEDAEIAASTKADYLKKFGMETQAQGVHFLTGKDPAIHQLAQKIGYNYVYDKKISQYAHPAGIVLLTPQGRVDRYMSGVLFEPNDLRLGLLDAGKGKIGSPLDLVTLKCYQYDGQTGKYTLAIMDILRIGGLATVTLIGIMMVVLVRRDVARTKAQEEEL